MAGSHHHSKHDLSKAIRKADKLQITHLQRHIFLCVDADERGCASKHSMLLSWKHLKHRLKALNKKDHAHTLYSKANCFDICKAGPIAVVYPDGVWYGRCTPEVLDQIIDQHLLGGKIVSEHVIADPFNVGTDADADADAASNQ